SVVRGRPRRSNPCPRSIPIPPRQPQPPRGHVQRQQQGGGQRQPRPDRLPGRGRVEVVVEDRCGCFVPRDVDHPAACQIGQRRQQRRVVVQRRVLGRIAQHPAGGGLETTDHGRRTTVRSLTF